MPSPPQDDNKLASPDGEDGTRSSVETAAVDSGEDELTVVDVLEDVVDVVESETKGAIERLRADVPIPNVIAEANQLADNIRATRSRTLSATLALYLAAAGSGLWFVLEADLADWYMHAGMYIAILSFLGIYVKAHVTKRRFSRGFYLVTTTLLLLFFAVVLFDLAPARLVLSAQGLPIEREAIDGLNIPAVLLLATAGGLIFHAGISSVNEAASREQDGSRE